MTCMLRLSSALASFALVSLLVAAAQVAFVSPIAAQDAGDDSIARGVALRRQGRNAEALAEFQKAYARDPSPRALAQIALAQQALGNWVVAETGLVDALAARNDPWIQR